MTATRPPGGSVFLVEDEVMIRMMVADMLEELGYSVAAEAGEINEAMKLAQSAEFDIAILDVNVNGKVISPVAELIKARNRPFIFATGYGSSGLPGRIPRPACAAEAVPARNAGAHDRERAQGRHGLAFYRNRIDSDPVDVILRKSAIALTEMVRALASLEATGRSLEMTLPISASPSAPAENSSSVRSSRNGVTDT